MGEALMVPSQNHCRICPIALEMLSFEVRASPDDHVGMAG